MAERAIRNAPELAAAGDIHMADADALLVEAAALGAHLAFEAAVAAYTAGLVRFRERVRGWSTSSVRMRCGSAPWAICCI